MVHVNMFGRGRSLEIAIIVACQMAFILFGYDQGVFSGIVGNNNFLDQFHHPNSAFEGIIVSIYNLGAFSGCIINFFIGDWTGRRLAMWIAMTVLIVGALLQSSSYSVVQLLIGRYVTGIGTGIETSTVPMYQSELTRAEIRGRVVSSEPLFVGVGIVIAYWFDYGMSFTGTSSVAWRIPIACQVVFAFLVIVLVFGLPESPRYLYQHGRNEEALQVLCNVHNGDENDERIQREQNDIVEALETERQAGEYKWSQLFKRDEVQTGKRIFLAYTAQFINQMGGINLVVYYITSVLQDNVGLTRNLSLILGGVINTMFIIGSFLPTFFLDRMGRRDPLMIGSFGLGICMMMISVLLSIPGKATSSAAVAFFFLYMLIFGGSINCIPWVYVPEILPLHARSKGSAIGISANWLWNFFVVMITPTLLTRLQWKAYLLFMCLNFAFVPFIWVFYPETSRLTLEEIDFLFTTSGAEQKSQRRHWFRKEEVMRSLDRDVLGTARQHHRNSVRSISEGMPGVTRPVGFDGEKEGKEEKIENV